MLTGQAKKILILDSKSPSTLKLPKKMEIPIFKETITFSYRTTFHHIYSNSLPLVEYEYDLKLFIEWLTGVNFDCIHLSSNEEFNKYTNHVINVIYPAFVDNVVIDAVVLMPFEHAKRILPQKVVDLFDIFVYETKTKGGKYNARVVEKKYIFEYAPTTYYLYDYTITMRIKARVRDILNAIERMGIVIYPCREQKDMMLDFCDDFSLGWLNGYCYSSSGSLF